MTQAETSERRWDWVDKNKIPVRIGVLSAGLLAALVVSTAVMTYDLRQNKNLTREANTGFHHLQVAAEANRNFAAMRYWLTDLSVSLLTLSERRADEARARLEEKLEELAVFAPAAAEQIKTGTDSYYTRAIEAADAYTDGNRVIGNTLLAQARTGSDAVDEALTTLITRLSAEADETKQAASIAADRALIRSIIACIVIVIVGAFLTWRVLLSIVRPMNAVNTAISGLIRGDTDVPLPPEGNDEFGRMSAALRALRDNLQRRRALERETEAQRNTILTAIETIPDGFALFDGDDKLVMVNDRYRKMFSRIEDLLVPGTPFEALLRANLQRGSDDLGSMPPDDWVRQRMAQHQAATGERQEINIDGAWVQVSKQKTPDKGTVAVYSDISILKARQAELELARKEAEAASSAKSQFLASMSHELRTPLNAIIGYSEMLSEDAEDMGFDSAREDLEKIMSSGRNLLSLINDVLDLSKIEAGKMELYTETFALKPLLEEVVATVVPLVAKNGNTLTLNTDFDDDEIETDKTKLRQNLFNLLSNAAKFTSNGEIDLIARRITVNGVDRFRFEVRDSGIGMTPEQRDKLFNAFVQADSSTSRNFGGTGLGLAIAQEFTRMMGGQITVESEEGVGSTFAFDIPVHPAPLPRSAKNGPAKQVTSLGRVLIIDDEAAPREALSQIVREQGYDVITAANAERGLSEARRQAPDAIILDVIMPERDGWSVLKEIKSDPDLCAIPVILATIIADREMGLAFGAVEHLIKPVDPALLVATLNDIAGSHGREVLIVDDDVATRNLFRRILVREGWTVREASDGQRALTQLDARKPTLMLLDIMMPNIDGYDVLKSVRANPDLADLPVIVVTSKDLTRKELDWLQAHAGDVIRKGETGRSDLVAALQRHLATFA